MVETLVRLKEESWQLEKGSETLVKLKEECQKLPILSDMKKVTKSIKTFTERSDDVPGYSEHWWSDEVDEVKRQRQEDDKVRREFISHPYYGAVFKR